MLMSTNQPAEPVLFVLTVFRTESSGTTRDFLVLSDNRLVQTSIDESTPEVLRES